MIGSGLKKLAAENRMRLDAGVAYGNLRGFGTTLFEGAGWKQLNISTTFPDAQKKENLIYLLQTSKLEKTFKMQKFGSSPAGLSFVFTDTIGTMKKIREFIDWFYPRLAESGATPFNVCRECGCLIEVENWYMVNYFAHNLHDACAQRVAEHFAEENKAKKEEDTGSYPMGIVGALIGALLGAVVWALVLSIGYIAAIVGLLIGWLALKGYDLCHGKQGKAKLAIVIVAVILGVLVGNIGADVFALVKMINAGELWGATYADIPDIIIYTFQESSEYARGVISNGVTGLLFAGLGVFGLLRKAGREIADAKIKKLK